MKIQILSDLHLEFESFEPPDVGADVVVLAGDIDLKQRGLEWAVRTFGDTPVVYVLGNHEFYGRAMPKHIDRMKSAASGTNVSVLENTTIAIGSVRFLGCSLWTDFGLHGDPEANRYVCEQRMTDYRKIRVSPSFRKLRTSDTMHLHHQSRSWLEKTLRDSNATTVVVTHHAPSPQSLGPAPSDDPVDAAYASDLEVLVAESGSALWIHGHIHRSADYRLGETRVVCNPRGYPNEPNPEFQPGFVVELSV